MAAFRGQSLSHNLPAMKSVYADMTVIEMMCVAAEKAVDCKLGSFKFEELRTKTDQQLIRIIDSDLDLGIRAARQALSSADRWTVSAEQSRSRTERGRDEVSRLLPLMYEVAGDELDRWEARLVQLGGLLKSLEAICVI
jgi:hypothetical protein